MSDTASQTLLPEGLRDVLSPDAAREAAAVETLSACFAANGYERVSPPLVEFESTLLAGMGAATADRIFRMVDPISQRTLGIRADVTAQIARLASTRLKKAPRPLRLMYAGQVLRVKGHQLKPERQFTQVGFELVGPDSVAADAEAILVAAEAVIALGVKDMTIDLALPPLVPAILAAAGAQAASDDELYSALNQKDSKRIQELGGDCAQILVDLVEASGPLDSAKRKLKNIKLPEKASSYLTTLFAVGDRLSCEAPGLSLTVDLVENRGLQYHTGLTFFLFAKGSMREIGRGGRYEIEHGEGVIERATGATLFVDSLLPVCPIESQSSRLYVSFGTPRKDIKKLQADGFRVTASLCVDDDSMENAVKLGCTHMFQDGVVTDVSSKG